MTAEACAIGACAILFVNIGEAFVSGPARANCCPPCAVQVLCRAARRCGGEATMMLTLRSRAVVAAPFLLFLSFVLAAQAQPGPGAPQPGAGRGTSQRAQPTFANLEYAPADPPSSNGHKLDLYLPGGADKPLPLVIWTAGSAWMADTGKNGADTLAKVLNPAGYAVAGVSIRSSSQVKFPGQLHDIKAAIRWLRANAAKYNLDPAHVAIMGDSSGGWTTAMAAVTGDAPETEGAVGTAGSSSAVQAAVAFYPPTDFLTMDAWALRNCKVSSGGTAGFCHDPADSPESSLVGCAIQTCPEKVQAANPITYITPADPPIMILHGGSDEAVPHNQGEQLYMALNKACKDAVFMSLPKAPHGNWNGFLTNDSLREAATIRSTFSERCSVANPAPYLPTWKTVTDFLDRYMKR